MSNKVIHSLRDRRLVEEAVAGLADTTSEAELAREVRRIADGYAPELVLAAVRRHLGTGSSQLRGGLGRLSELMVGPETSAMLRKEAGRRENSTQIRMNAAMILEKFLQVEVPAGLMGDLRDPNLIVMQSLQEAVEEARSNRQVLMEYVRQMRQESQEVAYLVLELTGQLAEADQPELLRLIAYDSRRGVTETALDRLSSLRGPAVGRQSALALHTLQATLRPDLAQAAVRNLRKLQLAGVSLELRRSDDWWALLSPSDLQGTQHLWFLENGTDDDGRLVGLRINGALGVLGAFGSESVDRRHLPSRRKVGESLSISTAPGESTVFVTVPYSYARHCLQRALEGHWGGQAERALPEEFTLFCPFVIQCDAGQISEELSSLLASGPDLWEEGREALSSVTAALLEHPAMAGWILQMGTSVEDTGENQRKSPGREMVGAGLQSLAGLPLEELGRLAASGVTKEVPRELAEQMRQGLLTQAGWLHCAGDQKSARHAVWVAESLLNEDLHSHPLLLQMIGLGILHPLRKGSAPSRSKLE
ncbi:MAG: hypothetical protein OXF54_10550 [Caldilineaceae bacterium]|nr:hypothetical protein [Caldilineaceae bacterium]